MQQYLYTVRPARAELLPGGPTPAEQKVVEEHVLYPRELAANGTLLLAGRTQTSDQSGFGIAIFRAPSDQDAEAIMAADPAVRAGVFRSALFPYRVGILAGAADLAWWAPES